MGRVRAYGPRVAWSVLGAWLLLAVPLAAQDYPAHTGKVNDFAELLSPAQRAQLEADLASLERDTSAEMAVVTLSSLNGRTVEDYATGLFNAWGIGKRDRDNGVLVLVSRGDRAMRIEVGYGLEGILPDGLAGTIIRETFRPRFRDDRYADGLLEGSARVIAVVRRNETVTPEQRAAYAAAAREAGTSWGMAAFLAIFIGLGAFIMGTAAGAQVVVQMLFGAVFMGGALFGATQVAPRASFVPLGLFAVGITVLGYRLGRRPDWRRDLRGTSARGGWAVGGGGGASSSSGGGSSSGSGNFGGGSSGGGGASGRW